MRFAYAFRGIALLCIAGGTFACAKGTSLNIGGSGGSGNGTTAAHGGAGPTTNGTTSPTSQTTGVTSTSNATTNGTTTNGTTTTNGVTTTGVSTTATTSTTVATTSTGPACSESPCKLTAPQCGCNAGAMCSIVGTNRACITAGSQGVGQACSTTNECAPGAICLAPVTTNSCLKFCSSDADCVAPGGKCFFTISDGMGGNVPNAMMCSQNCDPSSATSCIVTGLNCQAGEDTMTNQTLTFCTEAGTGGQNAACPNGATDCKAGFGCFMSTSNICLHWCKFPSGSGCPGVTTCQHLLTPLFVGATEYGVCQ